MGAPVLRAIYRLNVNPTCSAENKENAKESICIYIKKAYYNLDNKVNNI